MILEPQGVGPVARLALEHEFGWRAPAQIFGATCPVMVLLHSSSNVSGDTRIEAAVAAPQDVEAVGHRLVVLIPQHASGRRGIFVEELHWSDRPGHEVAATIRTEARIA